ncbi:Rossmann fold domain-containing protein [Erythrobacter sp. HA6-11]
MSGAPPEHGSAVLEVVELPMTPLDASRAFYADHMGDACAILEDGKTQVLTVHLPPACKDHDDWRRTLARDLARQYAPLRVNVIGAKEEGGAELLDYLLRAPGVTGQYCPSDD